MKCKVCEKMHFLWFSMWDWFLTTGLRIPPSSQTTRVGFGDLWCEKPYKMHTFPHATDISPIRLIFSYESHLLYPVVVWYRVRTGVLYGFPWGMDFSHHKSLTSQRVVCDEGGIRRQVVRNPSHMKNHKKCIFLTYIYFTLQGTLILLNTLRNVAGRENHVRWIYLTTVLNMGDSRKHARTDIDFPDTRH